MVLVGEVFELGFVEWFMEFFGGIFILDGIGFMEVG